MTRVTFMVGWTSVVTLEGSYLHCKLIQNPTLCDPFFPSSCNVDIVRYVHIVRRTH